MASEIAFSSSDRSNMHILHICIEFIINKGIFHLIEILGLLLHLPVERGGGGGEGEVLQGDVIHVVSGVGCLVLPLVTLKVSFQSLKRS